MPTSDLGVRRFLDRVADQALPLLPAELGEPGLRRRFTMFQIYFGQPKLHHELWIQRKRGQIELGLHLEAKPDLNGRLLQGFVRQMAAIQSEIGAEFEPEQWTKSWCRVHAYLDHELLDESVAREVSERYVAMIACLEPRLRALLAQEGPNRVRRL